MRHYVLRCELTTPAPLRDAFRVFEDPRNLAGITPPWLNFRITTPEKIEMRQGAIIDYRIRWLALPMRWRTIITEYDPPFRFVDLQARGPYVLWHHLHTFREEAEGTVVGDEVRYVLPLGPLGRWAHAAMVGRQLRGIFDYRQKALARLLGGVTAVRSPVITVEDSLEFKGDCQLTRQLVGE